MRTPSHGPIHSHATPLANVVAHLRADLDRGSSEVEMSQRLSRYGANAIDEVRPDPAWRHFFHQFREAVSILLLVAGVISNALSASFSSVGPRAC